MKETLMYKIVRPFLYLYMKFKYNPVIINKEEINARYDIVDTFLILTFYIMQAYFYSPPFFNSSYNDLEITGIFLSFNHLS